MWIRAVF
jgi:hypothetical protein